MTQGQNVNGGGGHVQGGAIEFLEPRQEKSPIVFQGLETSSVPKKAFDFDLDFDRHNFVNIVILGVVTLLPSYIS